MLNIYTYKHDVIIAASDFTRDYILKNYKDNVQGQQPLKEILENYKKQYEIGFQFRINFFIYTSIGLLVSAISGMIMKNAAGTSDAVSSK